MALLLLGCGAEEPVPSNVTGTLGSVTLTLGGGGWAWEEPRVPAGGGNDFRPYSFFLELSGIAFDPLVRIDEMELGERHLLAQEMALADRLSFVLQLTEMGTELSGGGSRFDTQDGDGTVGLVIGSRRAAGEPATDEAVMPRSIGKDRGWALVVDELSAPAEGVAGRVKGTLQLAVSRQTIDPPDSLTGDLVIDFDLPLVGSWLGQCQKALLDHPEGQNCPR
jgi:hypothetical protein